MLKDSLPPSSSGQTEAAASTYADSAFWLLLVCKRAAPESFDSTGKGTIMDSGKGAFGMGLKLAALHGT